MFTALPCDWIQPRRAKSPSALLTVSREAPTSPANSRWVRSCLTCRPSFVSNQETRAYRSVGLLRASPDVIWNQLASSYRQRATGLLECRLSYWWLTSPE